VDDVFVRIDLYRSTIFSDQDNFVQKACAIKKASELGMALICPDTSPRGISIEGDSESWDFGVGAGFYVDATNPKWKPYQMYSYINQELFSLVVQELSLDSERVSICGHSMGGHGALISALKNPHQYKCVSAFAPICNPSKCPWGIKAFTGYLGDDRPLWGDYDATELASRYDGPELDVLIDQGSKDQFLVQKQLLPEHFVENISKKIRLEYHLREGYDHSYWFIQSFIDLHLEFHARHYQLK
jgi:S-formylglutathione hydrolase